MKTTFSDFVYFYDISGFTLKQNDVFIEEEDYSSEKVDIVEEHLDGIDITSSAVRCALRHFPPCLKNKQKKTPKHHSYVYVFLTIF